MRAPFCLASFYTAPISRSRLFSAAASAIALSTASAALAGDEPLYDEAPGWIERISVDEVKADEAHDLIVYDQQVRIEEGQRWDYEDKVYRIGSVSDLSKYGTLKVQWMPDKGDLIVHEISITRDGEKVDVLDKGAQLDVLRRERQLERGVLDGSLTATLAVPGLAVGDELRVRYSITTADQALGDEVQSQTFLRREPSKKGRGGMMRMVNAGGEADYSRVLVSWPEGLDVRYQAGPNFEAEAPEARGGYQWLEVVTPLPEADPLPPALPQRYRLPAMLQVGTFADWAEVSSTMAPYYKVEGSLDGLNDLVEKVDAIAASPMSELEKAVAALELVQEDVRYLLNGLDGGNYLPQDVATTWDVKYGDCKAKTVMLLALLDHLGIEAEAVMASTNRGNAVPVSLPIPGAFNHVLVRAVIGGQEYFLDGTGLGANIQTVGNVPPFEYYLAIREEGADLQPIEQTLPRFAEMHTLFKLDSSAGGDLPTIGTMTMKITGARAAQMNAESDKLEDMFKAGFAARLGKGTRFYDFQVEPGEDDSELTITLTGIMPALFKFDGERGQFTPGRIHKTAKFTPNRSKPQWRDLPVAVGRPSADIGTFDITLPFDAAELAVEGNLNFEAEAAGKTFSRRVELDGRSLFMVEQTTSRGGEIAADQIREERRKAAKVASEKLVFVAPEGAPRRWRFAGSEDRSALEPIIEAFGRAIADEPEEASVYAARADFLRNTYDFAGALADFTTAIDLEATANLFAQRAYVHRLLRDQAAAKADYEEAYYLDSTPSRAMNLAYAMAEIGEIAEAVELLELEDGDTETRQSLAVSMAELDARQGNALAGLERIKAQLAEDPNNASLLNNQCWFIATWQVALDQGEQACRKAVERSENTAQAIDSRAMFELRMGELDKARADIDEALRLAPWQDDSLLLRGLIKRAQGDASAQADIERAIARRPSLADTYARWGFDFSAFDGA